MGRTAAALALGASLASAGSSLQRGRGVLYRSLSLQVRLLGCRDPPPSEEGAEASQGPASFGCAAPRSSGFQNLQYTKRETFVQISRILIAQVNRHRLLIFPLQ